MKKACQIQEKVASALRCKADRKIVSGCGIPSSTGLAHTSTKKRIEVNFGCGSAEIIFKYSPAACTESEDIMRSRYRREPSGAVSA